MGERESTKVTKTLPYMSLDGVFHLYKATLGSIKNDMKWSTTIFPILKQPYVYNIPTPQPPIVQRFIFCHSTDVFGLLLKVKRWSIFCTETSERTLTAESLLPIDALPNDLKEGQTILRWPKRISVISLR